MFYHVIENRFVHILELAYVFWGVSRVFCVVARVFSVANMMIQMVVNVICDVANLFLIVVLWKKLSVPYYLFLIFEKK